MEEMGEYSATWQGASGETCLPVIEPPSSHWKYTKLDQYTVTEYYVIASGSCWWSIMRIVTDLGSDTWFDLTLKE